MKTGKITNSVISRSVLKNIKPAKNSLAVKPSIGADASVLENGIVIYALTLLVALTGKWTRTTIGVCPESLVLLLLKEI